MLSVFHSDRMMLIKLAVGKSKFVPKRRVWKLQQADLHDQFCETFNGEMNDTLGEQVDDI